MFYPNPTGSGAFNPSVLSSSPAFTQLFPVIGFNPPSSAQTCSNSTGVDVNTRPFFDVIPNPDGTCSVLGAAGNGFQAGTGTLFTFEAVFTANLNVSSAGQFTFNVFSDDGFVLAIGPQGTNQPTRVSGPMVNPPPSGTSFVKGYPVLGALNVPTSPVANDITVNFPAAGSYPMEFDYTECCGGQESLTLAVSGTIVPPPPPPVIHSTATSYTGDTSGDFNDPAHLSATLMDTSASPAVPVPNETITLSLGAQSCTGTTDATGTAACTVAPNVMAGSYTVMARFAGDATFKASGASASFAVTLEEDTLTYTGGINIANGTAATLSGNLLEDGVSPVAGRSVVFSLGSGATTQSCTGTTNAAGTVICTVGTVAQRLGPGSVTALFTSDGFYRSAFATANTLIFATPATGSFVIGNNSASAGMSVNFWGAQWAITNSLSGGPAPDSFKGFAETLSATPPTCGSHWFTDTGNSSAPPVTAPSFMMVLVAGSVSQSGSVLSGIVSEIVVVNTNPGYLNDPGHPGTGTVVAIICHS
jgi:hypothetical protein